MPKIVGPNGEVFDSAEEAWAHYESTQKQQNQDAIEARARSDLDVAPEKAPQLPQPRGRSFIDMITNPGDRTFLYSPQDWGGPQAQGWIPVGPDVQARERDRLIKGMPDPAYRMRRVGSWPSTTRVGRGGALPRYANQPAPGIIDTLQGVGSFYTDRLWPGMVDVARSTWDLIAPVSEFDRRVAEMERVSRGSPRR